LFMHTVTRNSTAYGDALHVSSVSVDDLFWRIEDSTPESDISFLYSFWFYSVLPGECRISRKTLKWASFYLIVVCLRQFVQYKLTLYVLVVNDDASVSKRFLTFRDSVVAWFLFQA